MERNELTNQEVLNLLIKYFELEVPLLEKNYEWKIPQLTNFSSSLEKSFSANVELKHFLNKLWNNSDKTDFEVAEIIIKEWGGIKGNKKETIEKYIQRVRSHNFETSFKGLASYTKLYSIAEPERFAIYDARVAVTLNAIQYNANITSGIIFNYLSGRNNITGYRQKKTGFSQQKQFTKASLASRGWEKVPQDQTYQLYLNYLQLCIKHNSNWKLHELEMVLFANAEKEALKAMAMNSDNHLYKATN
jgi:hypothetical protein